MTSRTLVFRSLRFHWRGHLGVVLGAAVGSAALIGALVVGDSVRESLRERALLRLGPYETVLAPDDRFFSQSLGQVVNEMLTGKKFGYGLSFVPPVTLLKLRGTVARQDGAARANQVNILGVPDGFWTNSGAQRLANLPANSAILNETLASQLGVRAGDAILLRIHKPTAFSRDVPISPQSGSSVALRWKVHGIATAAELGDFSLRASQTPPDNAFVRLAELSRAVDMEGKVNVLAVGHVLQSQSITPLPGTPSPLFDLKALLTDLFTPTAKFRPKPWPMQILMERWKTLGGHLLSLQDAELNLSSSQNMTGAASQVAQKLPPYIQLTSERIFLDPAVVAVATNMDYAIDRIMNDPKRRFGPGSGGPPIAGDGYLLAPPPGLAMELLSNDITPLPPPQPRRHSLRETARRQGVMDLYRVLPPPLPEFPVQTQPILTYLANLIRAGTNTTPYSMVTAAGPPWTLTDMRNDEILVNQWLAEDLQLKPGETVELTYFLPESAVRLVEATNRFRVRAVVPLEGIFADRTLMPEFPGLAKAESTHDWDAGFPLVHKIRDKDEAYWKEYRGTPKAFVTLAAGQKMWGNRFGNLTAIRFPVPTNTAPAEYQKAIEQSLLGNLKPEDLGLRFEPVREEALKAANQGQDFGQLFLGFSFFLITAALILMGLLFQFGLEQRMSEVGTLLALGFTPWQVRWLFLGEGVALAAIGGLIGLFGGLGYAWVMLRGLTTIWRDAVNTSALDFHANGISLLLGGLASVVVSAITLWLTLRKQARHPARELLSGSSEFRVAGVSLAGRSRGFWIGTVALLFALGLLGWMVARGDTSNAGVFFGAGALLLIAGMAFTATILGRLNEFESRRRFTLASLGFRGCTRRRSRSLAVVGLLACGSFLIAAIGAFKLDANANAWKRASGTGGFALLGEATLPVVRDLNTKEGREFYGLDEASLAGVSVVPMRVRDGDDASCLNLNRAQKPRLLGVNPELLAQRDAFTFAQVAKGVDAKAGWEMLRSSRRKEAQPNEIPAIGDQNSILWAMGKKVGDTLDYVDEHGQPFKIRLVGAVANSILQGSLLIAEDEFIRRFPSESGYRQFLIDAPSNRVATVSATLSRALQDVGLELTPAARRLAAFNAVQNTYLNTFQILGGLGLLLASAGLGVVVLRNVLERRGELALLLAVGFRRRALQWLVLSEHGGLLWTGLGLGTVAAVVAVLPALLAPGSEIHYGSLGITLAAVLASGLVWTWGATCLALRGKLLEALRNE